MSHRVRVEIVGEIPLIRSGVISNLVGLFVEAESFFCFAPSEMMTNENSCRVFSPFEPVGLFTRGLTLPILSPLAIFLTFYSAGP
jgi:hypothetical protein